MYQEGNRENKLATIEDRPMTRSLVPSILHSIRFSNTNDIDFPDKRGYS